MGTLSTLLRMVTGSFVTETIPFPQPQVVMGNFAKVEFVDGPVFGEDHHLGEPLKVVLEEVVRMK